MKYKGTLITDASGSLNGLVFSHNTYGAYIRQRVTPTNPNTPQQQSVRALMANAHVAWLVLAQATKDAWTAYAAGTPIFDNLGNAIHITGRLMFLRDYILRKVAGAPLPPVVVSTMGLTDLTPPTPTVTAPATGSIAYTNTDTWATTTGGWLFIFVSQGKGQGINFFRGPYRFCDYVPGNTAVPPVSPKAITLPWNVQAGQKVFFRLIASDSEGRLSEEQFRSCTAS